MHLLVSVWTVTALHWSFYSVRGILTTTLAHIGLALQILERQGEIINSLGGPSALAETERVCRNWREYNAGHPVDQEDSGI